MTGYRPGARGWILSPSRVKSFSLLHIITTGSSLHNGYHGVEPTLPPTSALVKKTCIYIYIHLDCIVLSLFWFSSSPSLVIPRQMLGQCLDIMLQPLSSTSFLIHSSLSYHSALFAYWYCQWLGLQHLMAGWWMSNWKNSFTTTKCWTQVKPEPTCLVTVYVLFELLIWLANTYNN
jgi:hypothetical protein